MDFGHMVVMLVCLTACFFIGALNPAIGLARVRGVDVRASGSGNPGATNIGRVLGLRWGVAVGVIDVVKGWAPTALMLWVFGLIPALLAGVALVLGHVYSPYLGGRGGKGVASSLGAMLAVTPIIALLPIAVFVMALPWVRRVGDASAFAAGALVCVGVAIGTSWLTAPSPPVVGWWLACLGSMVLWRHRGNFARTGRVRS